MDRKKLKQQLLSKELLWQNIFVLLYLQKFNISPDDLKNQFDICKCVDLCRNEDDFCDIWAMVDELDQNYDRICDCIDYIYYSKPVLWQYDFVKIISRMRNIHIYQSLDIYALVAAFTLSLSLPPHTINKIYAVLDERHKTVIASLNRKQSLLKRNLLMVLECDYGTKFRESLSEISFREILATYLPEIGQKKFLAALQTATTAETELSKREVSVLGFAYYSPFFYNGIAVERHLCPPSSMFACVKAYLKEAYKYWQKLEADKTDIDKDIDEDDLPKNDSVFIDTTKNCIIDSRFEKHFFAHVYVREMPNDSMKNYNGDYLVFRNNFLYSVEFVKDFSLHPGTKDFVKSVNDAEKNFEAIQKKLEETPAMPKQKIIGYKQRQFEIMRFLNNCYCV